MNKLALSAPLVLAAAFGAVGFAVAAPAQASVVVAHFDDGDHDHDGVELDNEDPVTDQGDNKATHRIDGDEKTALGDDGF